MRITSFKFIGLLGLFVIAFGFEGYADNREKRAVNGQFNEIAVSSGIDLIISQGEPTEIFVEGDDDILNKIKTEVKGNRLNIYFDSNFLSWAFNFKEAKVYVTTNDIQKLIASAGSNIKCIGEINGESLVVTASGGADINISLKAKDIIFNASGGADIWVEGEADNVEARASGGSDIMARKLIAQRVKAVASGGADVVVFAEQEIEASASGGADVDYYGSPNAVRINESGGGEVNRHSN
ncbi:head GIN domain-containing protein [Thermophagus xiamenensis]|uniref:Putative auto-transporter adhesin, head GIN domain n=1 Tax=Thermophagus xiamenensis TaxID=385682 RepID=A0A1I1ZZK1_9BACT|nr:head GIN domain-containing protein [Thermophagus xiamenensis]SFE36927.1 Putative auto-transporter adhesin, head GIN domain [Thermophagus xiamenensis]